MAKRYWMILPRKPEQVTERVQMKEWQDNNTENKENANKQR
jgi:hypothetical protein